MDGHDSDKPSVTSPGSGLIERWQNIPLYGRIVIALVLGVITGLLLGGHAASLAMPCQKTSVEEAQRDFENPSSKGANAGARRGEFAKEHLRA